MMYGGPTCPQVQHKPTTIIFLYTYVYKLQCLHYTQILPSMACCSLPITLPRRKTNQLQTLIKLLLDPMPSWQKPVKLSRCQRKRLLVLSALISTKSQRSFPVTTSTVKIASKVWLKSQPTRPSPVQSVAPSLYLSLWLRDDFELNKWVFSQSVQMNVRRSALARSGGIWWEFVRLWRLQWIISELS